MLIILICIIGKTKFLLHETLLTKLITISRITKNIQTFVTSKNILSVDKAKKIIRDLKTNKAFGAEIPTKILRECEFTFDVLTKCVNKSIETGFFPDSLKLANSTPLF